MRTANYKDRYERNNEKQNIVLCTKSAVDAKTQELCVLRLPLPCVAFHVYLDANFFIRDNRQQSDSLLCLHLELNHKCNWQLGIVSA